MLEKDPHKRPNATEVLSDPFFTGEIKKAAPTPQQKKQFF